MSFALPHPDDALSGYLDDELTPDERAVVAAHLAECATCRAELDAERLVRDTVRTLPTVEPPAGFYDQLLVTGPSARVEPKRRFKFGVANLVATAAAWALILGLAHFSTSSPSSVNPVLSGFVSSHTSVAPAVEADQSAATGLTQDPDAPRRTGVPDELGGTYRFVGVREENGTPHLVYSDGERAFSLFVVAAQVDEDALPDDAQAVVVNGHPAWWFQTEDGTELILVERGRVTAVIVGAPSPTAVSGVASGPEPTAPADDPSFMERVESAGHGLLETFGLTG